MSKVIECEVIVGRHRQVDTTRESVVDFHCKHWTGNGNLWSCVVLRLSGLEYITETPHTEF